MGLKAKAAAPGVVVGRGGLKERLARAVFAFSWSLTNGANATEGALAQVRRDA